MVARYADDFYAPAGRGKLLHAGPNYHPAQSNNLVVLLLLTAGIWEQRDVSC